MNPRTVPNRGRGLRDVYPRIYRAGNPFEGAPEFPSIGRSTAGAFGLVVVGLAGLLGTVAGFAPHFDRIHLRQPELATALMLVVCGGLVVTGFGMFGLRTRRSVRLVPAATLVVFSLTGVVGSVLVFEPGVYGGVAGAFRGLTSSTA